MGLFDGFKTDRVATKAQKLHVEGNELMKRGKPAEAAERFKEAAVLYKEAREAGGRRPNILLGEAILLMRRGSFVEAREIMQLMSKECRLDEATHFELRCDYALCLWRLGLTDEAIKTIVFAGKYAKNSAYYTSYCSFMLDKMRKSGEFEDETRALLDEAMEYDDEDAPTLDNYGEFYRIKYERAKTLHSDDEAQLRGKSLEYYEKAYKLRPSQVTTLYALALFAEEDGDTKRAKELVDKAILHWASRVCAVSIEDLKALKARLNG